MDQGLFGKYYVSRVDERDQPPNGDKQGARYFVLDYVHDMYARQAVLFYASICEEMLPQLAEDLRKAVHDTWPTS